MDEAKIAQLRALTQQHTRVKESYLCVSAEPEEAWYALIQALGRKTAYLEIARAANALYEAQIGRPFLFSDACLAFEIGYHVDAYLWAKGYAHCRPHITALAFPKSVLIRHCKDVDISERDTGNLPQRLLCGYKKGIRECYRGTERDPFSRKSHRKT